MQKKEKEDKEVSHTDTNIPYLFTYILSFTHSCGAQVIWETKTDLAGFGFF